MVSLTTNMRRKLEQDRRGNSEFPDRHPDYVSGDQSDRMEYRPPAIEFDKSDGPHRGRVVGPPEKMDVGPHDRDGPPGRCSEWRDHGSFDKDHGTQAGRGPYWGDGSPDRMIPEPSDRRVHGPPDRTGPSDYSEGTPDWKDSSPDWRDDRRPGGRNWSLGRKGEHPKKRFHSGSGPQDFNEIGPEDRKEPLWPQGGREHPFNPGFVELNMKVHVPERSPNTGLGQLGPVERKNTKLDRNRNKEKIEPSNRGPPERQYPEHTWNTRIGDGLTPAITTAAMDGGVKKEESEDVNPVDLVPIRKKGREKVESPKDIPHETELKTSPMKWLHNPSVSAAEPMVWSVMVSDAQIRQDVPQPLNSEAEMGGLMKFSERVNPIEQKGARPVESMPIKKKSGVKVVFQEEIPDMAEWDISQMKELPDGVIQTARYTQGYHEIKRGNISAAVHSQSEKKLYIVPDTNVIISDPTFVQKLIDREITGYGKLVIYISRIVRQELVSLEKNPAKGMSSQEAARISWVKCNDDNILVTCLHLKQKDNGAAVVLLTNDNVLIIKALVCGGDPFTHPLPTLQHSQVNAQWRQQTPIVFKSYGAPLAEKLAKLYIVPDTNVIISDPTFVKKLIDREITGCVKPVIIIPWVVLQELDSLKKGTQGKSNLQTAARSAIRIVRDFLLETKHPPVKVQTPMESQEAAIKFGEECHDEILATCLHLKEKDNGACVVLLTNDSNRIKEALKYIPAYETEGLLSGLENLRHKD